MRYFSVRDFGAMGDGIADDTLAFQQAINAASQGAAEQWGKGGIVAVPPGRYRITAELQVANQSGIQIRGTGAHPGDKVVASGHIGPRATLRWDPASPQPPYPSMLRIKGCSGVTVEDLAFYGSTTGRGDVALIQFEDLGDFRTALNTFRRLTLVNAETGIRATNVSAGQVLFEFLHLEDLTTGVEVTDDDGAMYVFEYLGATSCNTVLNLSAGGCVNANMVEIISCGGTGPGDWCFKFGAGGPNVRCSRITSMHIEQGTKQLMDVTGDHRITLDSYCEGTGCTGTIRLRGGAVVLHACSLVVQPLIDWETSSRNTTVRVRDSVFNVGSFNLASWIPNPTEPACFYSIEKCETASPPNHNLPIADVRSAW